MDFCGRGAYLLFVRIRAVGVPLREPTQARHAEILLCVNAFASKSGLNAVSC